MKMREAFPTPTLQEVEALESQIGERLDEGYRRFLLTVGGGEPVDSEFEVPRWGITLVHYFLGLGIGGPYDILSKRAAFAGILPPDAVPIASDPGGNLVCLGTGSNTPEIFFWGHDQPGAELIPLAADFENDSTRRVPSHCRPPSQCCAVSNF